MDPCASTGEKMTEPEIDALMTGQEDENGSVHYEGKLWFLSIFFFLNYYYSKDFNMWIFLSPAFVKHIMSV